jgi:hypothetical protein
MHIYILQYCFTGTHTYMFYNSVSNPNFFAQRPLHLKPFMPNISSHSFPLSYMCAFDTYLLFLIITKN